MEKRSTAGRPFKGVNPIDVYKRLPGTNCGDCRQKACMPFAFALLKGEAAPSDCPRLTEKERGEMESSVRKIDWREDLISSLEEEIKKIQFAGTTDSLGAEFRDGKLFIRCFGRDVTVGTNGEIQSERCLTPWMRMLVLFYIRNGGVKCLSGKWVLHSELMGGLMKYKAFKRECEEPLKELFDKDFEKVASLLDRCGAERQQGFQTRNAWLIYIFPRLPVLFLYWTQDDEFESQISIRFDSTADKCFDVEQLIFLVEETVKDIEAELKC